ncbi:hypothetical protein L596_017611 [Steinernema carpocapsae]|uniref:Uncharacterized protein n=1 Tax=Steinernema carpocapsae TaxID=34508 RepID=A0A4U5N2W7_STECR|nr:hypothetical protein L596_017611 [Steinernema carpocapsae]
MKTAVFGHDESCTGSALANTGPVAPSLTFTPPATLSTQATGLHPRRSAAQSGAHSANDRGYRPHSRRTSRMQNVREITLKLVQMNGKFKKKRVQENVQ